MKIFEVVPQLSTGGAERFVVDLCNELSIGNEVILVVLWPLKGDQSFFLKQLSEKVKVECVNKKPGFDTRVFSRIYKLVKKYRPQIIHSHIDSIFYTWPFQVFFSKGVHTVHSSARHEAVNKAHRLIRFVFFHLKCIYPVTISKVSKDDFDSFYHMKSKLIFNGRDIPNNLKVSEDVKSEIDGYKVSDNTKVIIQLAHVDTLKRQLLMARVAKRLQVEGYDICVLFIGSYTRVPEYTSQIKQEMSNNCFFLGEKNNPLEYLKYGGAFGLCSSVEGFPISLIEALGVGAVPICTPVGGIPDVVVDGFNGFLADDLTEDGYYEAVKRYIQLSTVERNVVSENVINSYKKYSMRECAAHYFDYFKSITT